MQEAINSLKNEIVDTINQIGGGVSMVEICRIEGMKGDNGWVNEKNWVYWLGLSDAGVQAMIELVNEHRIIVCATSLMVYLIDGGYLDLPIVKQNRIYKERHWLPICLNTPQTSRK